ncbi:hypothetical protein DEJ45_07695 [Streptomyces venezuelae]|uniref:hypothetical protein n=1 Tax=Streptomyces venezuelae TaxID=54571 RepID=UPI00123DBE42|nr:hypothetical protein [Streptomyces venezuelae]QES12291.1 hypothetical protein DEJ45_07695 [Streptomyces venezuelae]
MGKKQRRKEVTAGLDAERTCRDKLEHDFYVEGMLSEDRFKALAAEQSAVIESLDQEAAELAGEVDLSVLFADGEALAGAWAESTLADRRMLLGCILKSLTIVPARFPGDRTPILGRVVPQGVASRSL